MAETVVGSLSKETYERFRRNSDPPADPQAVFLFVGGPLDGQRRRVELKASGHPPEWTEMLVFDHGANRGVVMAGLALPPTTYRAYVYRLVFVTDAGRPGVGLYVGEDVKDPFARLLAGYKPEAV